jgi:hypothetical protein
MGIAKGGWVSFGNFTADQDLREQKQPLVLTFRL